MVLTKPYIERTLKVGSIGNLLSEYAAKWGDLIYILEVCSSAGLFKHININDFIDLLQHDNEKVRILVVRLIGREKDTIYLSALAGLIASDDSSMVRREAVSSIGRMRSEKAVPYLLSILDDKDPKIVCQAIRGLLVFKNMNEVQERLKELKDHENETIRSIIIKEFFSEKHYYNKKQNHTTVRDFLKNVVVNADVQEVLKFVPDDSIHLTFTSPPYYNARDYSIYPSYEAYLNFMKEVFEETYRITKEGRFLIVNTSPVIVPRISRAHASKRYPIPFDIHHDLMKMGWEFIDDIVWLKPEYSVKNRVGGFQQHRKPLGYKPNAITEYLMVYRKHTDKLLDWNMHQYSKDAVDLSVVLGDFETSNVWQINPKSDKIHSAVFPTELCQRVIQYYSYVGDLVFDPFGGSGTCGRTARALNRYSFMTEIDEKYFRYIQQLDNEEGTMFANGNVSYLSLEQFINTIK